MNGNDDNGKNDDIVDPVLINIEYSNDEINMYIDGAENPVHTIPWGEKAINYFKVAEKYPKILQKPEVVTVDSLKSDKLPSEARTRIDTWLKETRNELNRDKKTYLFVYNKDPKTEKEWRYSIIRQEDYKKWSFL